MKFNELNHRRRIELNKYNINIGKVKLMINNLNKYGDKIRIIESGNTIVLERVNNNFRFNVFHN
jgi:hypothetical protein